MDEFGGGIFGTPEDALEKLAKLQELSGGFGTILSFAHDWAPREKMWRSYELIARYVMPRCQGLLDSIDASAARVTAKKHTLMAAATGAIMKAISSDQRAADAMASTVAGPFTIAPAQNAETARSGK
jgi:limonene 1,2-monooxygenase